MAINGLETIGVIEVMENFLEKRRPPEHLREQIDLGYRLKGQSIEIFETHLNYALPGQIEETPIAKVTFVRSKNVWKVFWMRANLKWYAYDPMPTVKDLNHFTQLVDEDNHGCFFG